MIFSYREAIRKGFHEVMTKDPTVFMIGVGLSDPNAIFGTLRGFYEEFGPKRIIEAPLAEGMLTGLVLGAALNGLKPILVHSRINFAFLGMDQIVNHICVWNEMFGGNQKLPIMIRGVEGHDEFGAGMQHCGSYINLFAGLGLECYRPNEPKEAYSEILQWHKREKPAIYCDSKIFYELRHDWDCASSAFQDPLPEETAHINFPKQYPKPAMTLHQAWELGYQYGRK
jgi:acetoin:2,6-dichlorophenolindophenol oxidoreductase subunit beta